MKTRRLHDRMAARVPGVLADLLGIEPGRIRELKSPTGGPNFLLASPGHSFAVEFKSSSSAAHVAQAARTVAMHADHAGRNAIPIVAVPFMGEAGRNACAEAGVGWLDLAGNAGISAKNLLIRVEGRPNPMRSPGRKANLFAPKSSRVTRWLLMNPGKRYSQREIAGGTFMDEGYVSRIVRRMEKDAYVTREEDGSVRVQDPGLLLDAWHEDYRFSRHEVRRGHVPARSGPELLHAICGALEKRGVGHAATGLAAAWMLTKHAAFRIATLFLEEEPPEDMMEEIGFREEARGANLWLAHPDDEGVFYGSIEKSGVRCVHPVQVYLDLKDHPERSVEAAGRIREDYLAWKKNA